ncbi:hypothetical protein Y032_0020g212 [Ancylostoma ceylanicum]|uniref:Uncharacterized protein n=1 Tax=Ancylostoma ceylanicum TaxID=53326 RepID=A0A016V2Z6_9BILA|nr:hypothetical protein Y032_0020g212 [Ancylostoma ceylanicum]
MTDLSSKNAKMNSLLNRKRKVDMGAQPAVEASPGPSQITESAEVVDRKEPKLEQEERRKAADALLRESKRAKERAEMVGPQGWSVVVAVLNLSRGEIVLAFCGSGFLEAERCDVPYV